MEQIIEYNIEDTVRVLDNRNNYSRYRNTKLVTKYCSDIVKNGDIFEILDLDTLDNYTYILGKVGNRYICFGSEGVELVNKVKDLYEIY